MTNAGSKDRLMSVAEVAAALNISSNSVWLRSQTGVIPKPILNNGTIQWRHSDMKTAKMN
jgi:predicted DNA-binding transcriptional regulator AlpA